MFFFCDARGLVKDMIGEDCVLLTCGDGACGLHAAFGQVEAGELICVRARENAVNGLDACYMKSKIGEGTSRNFNAVMAA